MEYFSTGREMLNKFTCKEFYFLNDVKQYFDC